jgi:hypothetical protein
MTSELERASALVGELETKRAQHVAKAEKLAAERDEIALGAFTGNGKQRERVDEIHTTLAKHSSELAALDSALKSAHQRVADRRAAQAQKVARERAAEARKLAAELGECFPYLDKHLAEAANALLAIEKGFAQLRALGIGPTDAQVRLNITRGLESWAQRGLSRSWFDHLRDGFKYLAPHERRTFSEYWRAVEASLQNAIGQREPSVPQPPKPTKEERAA